MNIISYGMTYLLWTGLVVNAVVLCVIYHKGTHPKNRKDNDEKGTLTVVYRVPREIKGAG
jgi:hypothetical protein